MKFKILFILIFIFVQNIYSQTPDELYNQIATNRFVWTANELNSRIQLLQKIIKMDDNFIEAHLLLANTLTDLVFKNPDIKQAKLHYDKCIYLLNKGIRLKTADHLTEREIFWNVAFAYEFALNIYDNEDYYLNAVRLYEKALDYPHDESRQDDSSFTDLYSADKIKINIVECYESLASINKYKKNYYTALDYLYKGRYLCSEIKYNNYILERINKEIIIDNLLSQNNNWQVFTIPNKAKYKAKLRDAFELISSTNYLYLYNVQSLEKASKNTIRVWLLAANMVSKDMLNINDIFQEKILINFDLKTKKYQELEYISYNKNFEVLNDYSPEKNWDFIVPDSIFETIYDIFIKKY